MGKITPYRYQIKVGELLLKGQSVILQAPTGAGKTATALLPFLHAQREDIKIHYPTKCVYVVPMRVLAHQFASKFEEEAGSYQRKFRRKIVPTLQTGDAPHDPRYEKGDVIFCTVDQFLSSYFTMPYGLPNRMANINAGAFVGAYLVFDEFHLFDPESTLPSVIYAIKQLSKLAPVLVMTATFSKSMLDELAKDINATPVLVSSEEALKIESRIPTPQPRQRVWSTADILLNAEAVESILFQHRTRSLVLCNTVRGAQSIFRRLRDLAKEKRPTTQVLLLHSRFLPKDRRDTENALRKYFGNPHNSASDRSGSYIAVATQTIEVGVDISAEILHTELAPASALIQRAGRCARFPGEQGEVIVYPVETFRPYANDQDITQPKSAWGTEMRAALDWLRTHSGAFDFGREQELVNAVATERDRQILGQLSAGRGNRAETIQRALRGEEESRSSKLLVRDADSRLVLVHPDPDTLLENPYRAIGFSVSPLVLFGMTKEWLEREGQRELEWRVKWLYDSGDKDEDNRPQYKWENIYDPKIVFSARVVVVNPQLAGYWSDEGFVSERGGSSFQSTLPESERGKLGWSKPHYQLETYETHIQRVLAALKLIESELRYAALALEKAAEWPAGSVLRAVRLACLLHDVGKLSQGWQGWVRAYEKAIGEEELLVKDEGYAHTHSRPNEPRHEAALKSVKPKKPHHAGESALAVCRIMLKALDDNEILAKAALTAITRHHTPFAAECGEFTLEAQTKRQIERTLKYAPDLAEWVDIKLLVEKDQNRNAFGSEFVIPPDNWRGWLAYLLIVRALRRADQTGTAEGTK